MTEDRRVFLNVDATYGRSLYGLALGLLCGRWTRCFWLYRLAVKFARFRAARA